MTEPVALTSIVVVAADSGPALGPCIDAALASSAAVELVLVDNASVDGEVERLAQRFSTDPRLHILRNADNIGFGPACNRGAAIARGDVLLFLNPDCDIRTDTVARLRTALHEDPRLGLLGVTVCDPDGPPARGNRRRDPLLRRALASMSGLSRHEARWPALQGVEMPARIQEGPAIERVDAVSGACMALPRAVFERVGGFDEGYFLHVEDLDLCRRVRDAGFAVAIVHALRVTHAQGGSSRHRRLFVERHKLRGMWRWFNKFDPAAQNPFARAFVRVALALHGALCTLRAVIGGR
ncbi:MAG: glycosyltransferase family 2 protein [Lysobacteraceae bacterium]|nr:MAG: glycosyltransferase family 2 protein [Xanthomonadaceae bacterium]